MAKWIHQRQCWPFHNIDSCTPFSDSLLRSISITLEIIEEREEENNNKQELVKIKKNLTVYIVVVEKGEKQKKKEDVTFAFTMAA